MKITRTASGKKTIRMSKSEWMNIGKKAGWMKLSSDEMSELSMSECEQILEYSDNIQKLERVLDEVRKNSRFFHARMAQEPGYGFEKAEWDDLSGRIFEKIERLKKEQRESRQYKLI